MRLIRLGIAPAALLGLAATAVLAQDPPPPPAPPAPPPPFIRRRHPLCPHLDDLSAGAVRAVARSCAAAGHAAGACACPDDNATRTPGPACAARRPGAAAAKPACALPPLLGRARLCLARHLRLACRSGPDRPPAGKDRAKLPARPGAIILIWREREGSGGVIHRISGRALGANPGQSAGTILSVPVSSSYCAPTTRPFEVELELEGGRNLGLIGRFTFPCTG